MATLRQKRAIQKTVENGGNITQAMKDVGYKKSTINNPSNLTRSDGFKELLDEFLPELNLMKVHKEGLEANKTISAVVGTDATGKTMDFIDVPDHPTRHKFLETAYKLRKRLSPEFPLDAAIIIPVTIKRGEYSTEGNRDYIASEAV